MPIILFIIALMSSFTYANQHENHKQHHLMGSHGMVLIHHQDVGIFASHLPLYHTPHDYQIIYRVNVEQDEVLKALLSKDMVTILPEPFDLMTLVNKQQMTTKTAIYQGHFERGGVKVMDIEMTFATPILVERVDPNFVNSDMAFYRIPVANNLELTIHKIQQAPSFDAISLMEKRNKSCELPNQMTEQAVLTQLNLCGAKKVLYLETRDFAAR